MFVCKWCKNLFIDVQGFRGSDQYCSKECKRKAQENEERKRERDTKTASS